MASWAFVHSRHKSVRRDRAPQHCGRIILGASLARSRANRRSVRPILLRSAPRRASVHADWTDGPYHVRGCWDRLVRGFRGGRRLPLWAVCPNRAGALMTTSFWATLSKERVMPLTLYEPE